MSIVQQKVETSHIVLLHKISGGKKRLRTKDALPCCYRNRPEKIRKAIRCVWEIAPEFGLSRAATSVLQAILAAGLSVGNPFAPVFARKSTLARMARCSEVTVYRALKKFESLAWIVRMEQSRLDDGSIDIGRILLTEKIAALLHLVKYNIKKETLASSQGLATEGKATALQDGNEQTKLFAAAETKMKDGLTGGSLYGGKQDFERRTTVKDQSTQGGFIRMEGRAVARELFWLIAEGRLSFGQLFKLQVLSKQVPGQRLSDYVALRKDRIRQLQGTNDCYRYLKKLIDEKLDAKYLNVLRRRAAITEQKQQVRAKIAVHCETWCRRHNELTVIDHAAKRAYRVNGLHGLLEVTCQENRTRIKTEKITQAFIQAVEEGRLIPVEARCREMSREEARVQIEKMWEKLPWTAPRPAAKGLDIMQGQAAPLDNAEPPKRDRF